jgi:hypothetical protein
MKRILSNSLAVVVIGAALMAPSMAGAQSWHSHRQNQKEQWKDLAIGAGALGLLGVLTHNDTLTFGGLAGAAYSGWRYDQDGRDHRDRYDRDRDWDRYGRNDRRDSDRHRWDRRHH